MPDHSAFNFSVQLVYIAYLVAINAYQILLKMCSKMYVGCAHYIDPVLTRSWFVN